LILSTWVIEIARRSLEQNDGTQSPKTDYEYTKSLCMLDVLRLGGPQPMEAILEKRRNELVLRLVSMQVYMERSSFKMLKDVSSPLVQHLQ
jgi:hypothetical protein